VINVGMSAKIRRMHFRDGMSVREVARRTGLSSTVLFGMLTRYNKKTVTVITDGGQRWNVAPGLLRRVVDVNASEEEVPNVTPLRRK